jgi:lysophospholipase L1-like esterase
MTTSPSRRRLRSWLLALAAVLIGSVLALGLAEATLRIFDLAPVDGLATVTQQDFERLPGLFMPGQRLVDRTLRERPFQITIDSLGYRDTQEMQREKPAGEIRILMLGDSFTFGHLVDDEDTLPAQLERRLRPRCGDAVRTINAGVGGSSLDTASVMADRSRPLGVDVAVLTFSENDVTDLAIPLWSQLASNRAMKSRFPMSLVYPVVRRLAVWNLLLKARGRWRNFWAPASPLGKPAPGGASADPKLLALRDEYRQRLIGLRDGLASRGVPLVLGIFPSHLTVYGESSDEQVLWVEQTAREAGLPAVNFTPTLRGDGRSAEALYQLPYDGHPSPAGYALVAPLLEEALVAMPPLAGRCSAP